MADDDMYAAVQALLAQSNGADLPPPEERARLRRAAGVMQHQVAAALGLKRPETVSEWETGTSSGPRGKRRAAYAELLKGWAEKFPAPAAGAASVPAAPGAEAAEPEAAPVSRPAKKRSAQAPRRNGGVAGQKPAAKAPAGEGRFADGPLVVLDGDGTAYGRGGQVWECPATDVVSLVEWALREVQLGAERLHDNGTDEDPLVALTAGAVQRLGLPAKVEAVPSADGGRRMRRLPDGHPVLTELEEQDWQLTKRGFGPWARIYRPVVDGRRQCVQLCIVPWDALEADYWGAAAELPPPQLARALGAYASRVLTPRSTTAVNGLELMTALRPATRPVWDETANEYRSGPLRGSLVTAVEPPLPEASIAHPLAVSAGLISREPEHMVDEEAYNWARDPQTLTDAECALPWAVGLDVNVAFLAAANRLTVGIGEPEHVMRPAFDKRIPGCWLADLSHIETDPRLPSPFTPDGTRPTGPAWYESPTLAYAGELGAEVEPLEGHLYRTPQRVPKIWKNIDSTDPGDFVDFPATGGYLDPWYQRLAAAYAETMAALGVPRDMAQRPADFLAAMEGHKERDAAEAAVLTAIKASVKGGLGKLYEGPKGRGWRRGQPWSALERETWRPHIRYTLIANARMWMHRRMRRMAEHGHYPLGVLSDCVVYPSPGPSPLDLIPYVDGKPAKGVFPLGPAPGQVKHEGTRPFLWAAEMLDSGANPAQFIKGNAVAEGE